MPKSIAHSFFRGFITDLFDETMLEKNAFGQKTEGGFACSG
jgi:hypothetical protein